MTVESLDAEIQKLQDEVLELGREMDSKRRILADLMRQRNALLLHPSLAVSEIEHDPERDAPIPSAGIAPHDREAPRDEQN